ncbi:hypothetical protein [Arboricoccus pini]|nr:hypothetical protein [Arboricoccus pini]
MFPFRRGNSKKRGKGGGGNGGGGGNNANMPRRHQGNPRRVPGSAGELLPLLQPTTKALAQVLAGNTRASGQVVHARNILSQAQRLIDERQVDRMAPVHREEFLEQVARLRLTLADAEEDDYQDEADSDPVPKPAHRPLTPERLRELALSLAGPAEPPVAAAEPESEPETLVEVEAPAAPVMIEDAVERSDIKAGSPRSARLRLRTEG